ncbi:nuclease-related domain-containing protein [Candidatus Ferrigenium straubiae]|jgi:hypothetical protein|uniref:nuclease-related domain-containing protein n=1 Tax=Candidatus Ferrigenium straubiae TaxID=2919506 RepID=UPI003F4A9CA1
MIKKELDPFVAEDKYAAAGQKAEEQMAFYLKRFFAPSPDVFVLNGIRLEHAGDAAQMDHLVLHRYGIVVVESKSVAGKVQIKDDGQWIRWYGKDSTGMASPIIQAKLQLRFMRDYLNLAVKPKGVFDRYAFDVQVAISDSGVILWPTSGNLPEVCKADQVAERIEKRIAEFAEMHDAPSPMGTEHLAKIADFLCAAHKPLHLRVEENYPPKYQEAFAGRVKAIEKLVTGMQTAMVQSASRMTSHMVSSIAALQVEAQKNAHENKTSGLPDAVVETTAALAPHVNERLIGGVCSHCSSENVSILFGRNYYFHCNDCNKNSPLKSVCSSCGSVEIPHKKSNKFFLECKPCNTSRLFHVNS